MFNESIFISLQKSRLRNLMKKKYLIILSFFIVPLITMGQIGAGVYSFLDLPVSSRLSALGGTNVSMADGDINFVFRNPALLTSEMDKVVGLNFSNYLADINYGSAVYGMTFGEKNHFAFGIQYANYGNFEGYNEYDEYQGDFTANDIGIYVSYARPVAERFAIGATLKPIFSVYEKYTSIGIALDAGVSYIDQENLFSMGLVLRNMGTQIKGYYSDIEGQNYESLPFDIQFGATKKLKNAPFRFSLTLHNLHRWNLRYQSTNQKTTTLIQDSDEDTDNEPGFFDKAFRHVIVGVEFIPSEKFYITAAYNHRRNRELRVDNFKSMAGFSFGAGIKLYKFQVGFGMTQFQKGLFSYQFSIVTSLSQFNL